MWVSVRGVPGMPRRIHAVSPWGVGMERLLAPRSCRPTEGERACWASRVSGRAVGLPGTGRARGPKHHEPVRCAWDWLAGLDSCSRLSPVSRGTLREAS